MSKEKEIFKYLHSLGCCKYCCLRYLCIRSQDIYIKIDSYITENKFLDKEIISDENASKKHKRNPCVVCLGLLQDFCMDTIVEKVIENEEVKCYDSKVFTCSISFPACLYVREHSMRLHLEEKFPDFFVSDILETQLNKVWKWIIRHKLEEKLDKTFECSDICDFFINIVLNYELDTEVKNGS